MTDWSDTNHVAEPRLSNRFEGDGTWSAWARCRPIGERPSVTAAWDVIDRTALARPRAASIVATSRLIVRGADRALSRAASDDDEGGSGALSAWPPQSLCR